MMPPALMLWPPKTFIPNRWALLSRPLRDVPPPFLCAIFDLLYLDLGIILPMADGPVVVNFVMVLKSGDFVGLAVPQHLGRDPRVLQVGGADLDPVAIHEHQYVLKGHALGVLQQFNLQGIPLADLVLFSAGFNDCVHSFGHYTRFASMISSPLGILGPRRSKTSCGLTQPSNCSSASSPSEEAPTL